MDGFSDKALLVDIIRYASIVSAALFGLLGLLTEYKKDGKTTVWGKVAAAGIGLSAALAISSGVIQDQIAGEERAAGERAATEQRRRQQAEFEAQLAQFRLLNDQMSGINRANSRLLAGMGASLRVQDMQLRSARRNLLVTEGLRVQERTSTAKLLQTLWEDANRVEVSGVVLQVGIECGAKSGAAAPQFFGTGALASIAIAPAGPTKSIIEDLDRFGSNSLLLWLHALRGLDGVSYMASRTHTSRSEVRSDLEGVAQLATFSQFAIQGQWLHLRPGTWRDAVVEIHLVSEEPDLLERLRPILVEPVGGLEELARDYFVPEDYRNDASRKLAVLPCFAGAQVLANGRLIAQSRGRLVWIKENRNQPGVLVIKFHIQDALADAFPAFEDLARN